jgi:Tfp pilus assembly protein PilF
MARKILAQDKKHIPANVLLAQIMERQGNISSALEIIEKITTDKNQTNAELLIYSAELNNKAGNYSAANDKLKILFKTKPNSLRVLHLLIETALFLNKLEDAIKYQERLILNSPTKDVQVLEEKLADLKLKALINNKALSWDQIKTGLKKLAKKFPQNQKIRAELEKI